jgi:DNA-directed RNA polymerase subunit RPC12/RpoP
MPSSAGENMPDDYDDNLLKQGILHFRSKEFGLARRYFERALDTSNDLKTLAEANYYLSQVEDDPRQKRKFLEETLAVDMGHAGARRALAILDGKLKKEEIVNPNALPAPVPGMTSVQADRFPCPQCGGRMVYSPDGTSLVCESCSRQQKLDTRTPGPEQDFFVAMANGMGFRKTGSAKTFNCQGCGAKFVLTPSELTGVCAYCGSAHVIVSEKASELVEPDAIIPMVVDQKQAREQVAKWAAGKRFEPQQTVASPRGLYLPVWAFNLIGSIPWSGQVIRNKREMPISGESPALYNDICVPGSTKLATQLLELMPEYSLSSAPAYDPRFLSGWPAQVCERSMSDAALEARRITVERICRDIYIGHGNVLHLRYSASSISITSYRLILLPLWIADYTLEDESHQMVINGQTGTVLGDIPSRGLKDRLEDLFGSRNV